jgi:hypothetical protein
MSVLCPILRIIVRKIPNSWRNASSLPSASLPGIGRVVARGDTSSIVGLPHTANGGGSWGMMMTRWSPHLLRLDLTCFGRFRPASFHRDRQSSGREVLPHSYSPDQSHQKYHQSCSIKAAASAFRVPTPWSTMSLQYKYCWRPKSSASPRVFGLRRTWIFTTS